MVDQNGNVVPTAAIPVRFTVTGAGELAATGSSAPNDASSFRVPLRKTCEGRCLVILRPVGDAGKITLKADADGLKATTIGVRTISVANARTALTLSLAPGGFAGITNQAD